MILLSTPTSPFGRKVKIAAAVCGLTQQIEVRMADPWTEDKLLWDANPLGKMPALITDAGATVYDSGVILTYFDTLLETPKLFPAAPQPRIETATFHALGNGLTEAGLLMTYERLRRPAEFCYEPWIDHQRGKLERGLASLLTRAPDPRVADAGAIAIACALGYFDWRKPIDWRAQFPALVTWLDAFAAACPAFEATEARR